MHLYLLSASLNSTLARKTTFCGREFLVVPARLVQSQVLRNNLGASFLPPEEITPDWASLWNGIPVLIGDHPQVRGQPVSGRQPDLLNSRGAGWIFNAFVETQDGGARALRGEVWIDLARIEAVSGLSAIVDRVLAGQPVELSTGFPANIENAAGIHNGNTYEVVLRPAGADHLVILTEAIGACSIAHGCGLGVNKEQESRMESKTEGTQGAPTKAAATDANNAGSRGKLRGIFDRALDFLAGREDGKRAWFAENASLNVARAIELAQSAPTSDQERASQLCDELQEEFGDADKRVVVADVYSAALQVVFWFMTPFGPLPEGDEFFRTTYTETAGEFEFTAPVRVQRRVIYEDQAGDADEGAAGAAATNAALTDKTTTNCGCQPEAPMLETEKKELVNEITASLNTAVSAALAPVTGRLDAINAAVEAAAAKNVANETALNELKAQVTGLAGTVNAERDIERQALVTELSTNSRSPFSAAELEAKPLDELRKLATMAKVTTASYSGRGAPRTAANVEREAIYADPKPYYVKDEKVNTTEAK